MGDHVWWYGCGCGGVGVMVWVCLGIALVRLSGNAMIALSLSWSSMFHREAMINALYAAFWSEGVSGVSID